MKISFLRTHKCMRRIWACRCLDDRFGEMRGFHFMFYYKKIRRKRALEKYGVLSHIRSK